MIATFQLAPFNAMRNAMRSAMRNRFTYARATVAIAAGFKYSISPMPNFWRVARSEVDLYC